MIVKCKVEGCDKKLYVKGYCSKHYRRVRLYGDPDFVTKRTRQSDTPCSEPGCDKPAFCKGICKMHRAQRERAEARKLAESENKILGNGLCRIEDCIKNAYFDGLCELHHRYSKEGKLDSLPPSRLMPFTNVGPCNVEDCLNGAYKRGLCTIHYQRWQKGTDTTIKPVEIKKRTCSVDGCNNPYQAHGYCEKHNQRLKKNGLLDRPWDELPGETDRERYLNYLKAIKKARKEQGIAQ